MARRPRRTELLLAAGIVTWTAVAWGGRIGLAAGGEDLWAWARIGGSFLVAVIAAAGLALAPSSGWARMALWAFATWTLVVWGRSLVVNWTGQGSLPFKLVHTALAVGFFALAWWGARTAATEG